jgi:SAM-dependent methyltransferase
MDSEDIRLGRLYDDLADLIPLLSPPEEYAEEAGHWRSVLREKLGPGRHPILELGVGGGFNLSHLTSEFEATGVDISEAMLAQCRKLNPGVELHRGDMRSVRLGRTFAAVLIHDAVSDMLSEADLAAAFRTAAVHLERGGVLIMTPDRFAEAFHPPEIGHATHSDEARRLTYVEYTDDPDPADTTIETIMFYLIRERGCLRIEPDRHVSGLFPRATWMRTLDEAGFVAETRSFPLGPDRRPYELLVGVLRS